MRILALVLLTAMLLAGCVVVPAEPGMVVGPPRFYVSPPPVTFVIPRPYYGYGYYGGGRYR